MASRIKDRGGGKAATASRPLTPKPFSSSASRRTPTAAGKENSASRPSKPTSAVRWSTSSIPRASRIPSSVESSKHVSTLRAAALPGRASVGKDLEAETGLRRSVSGGIKAASEKGRRSVGSVGARVSDARRGSGGAGADEIGRRRAGFDSRGEGIDEISRKREGFDAKAKQTDEIGRKRQSFDANPKQIRGKGESFDVNVVKQCGDIRGKRGAFDANVKKQSDEMDGKRENTDLKAKLGDEISRKKDDLDMKLVKEINPKKDVAGLSDSGETSSKVAAFSAPQKDGEGGNSAVIPVFTVHVVDSNDVPCGVREQQKKTEECKKQEEKGKLADKIRVFEKAAASGEGRSVKAVCGVNKYPSKLHEKLAALEGRVQKIATEIKKTKEMLDENNPDEPKQILSNIQKEITTIEKAISHVKDDSKIQLGTADSSDCESSQAKKAAKCAVAKPGDSKHAGKGMNIDELEVRFFPHHKLLRDRKLSSATQQESCVALKKGCNGKMELATLDRCDDENSIAMEFLASLDGGESDFFKDRRAKNLEKDMIREAADASSKTSGQGSSKNPAGPNHEEEIELLATEKLEEFDEQENKSSMVVQEEIEESSNDQLSGIGNKSATGGWFVSEGEAVLLAHGDGTCSYYDIANHEFKSEYKPPSKVSHNMWGDCWLIRAPGVDGCSGRYVVAASAGNALEPGFCSWDYYSREVKAFHVEAMSHASSVPSSRTVLGSLPNVGSSRSSFAFSTVERQQWWYRPCGPLLLSTASKQKMVTAYDIRDGDVVMKWEVNTLVLGMEYSSPLQWRSRGKVVIAGNESLGLWDVNSLNPQPLLSVASSGKRVYCLHVNNTDAEVGGGVRQRVSSSEVEGNDGVFSTQESVNVFDFRVPAGIGLKIARHGGTASSIFSRGDSVFIGSTEGRLQIKGGLKPRVQQYSLRKGKLFATYELPEFNAHFHHSSITQVWGNTNLVLAACGMGLFAFDTFNEDIHIQPTYSFDCGNTIGVREAIGSDDLYCPTFDYSSSRVLLVSRDRPAHWSVHSPACINRIRDFYMEISFHFESSVIPFIGRIAPSDTYRIWKRGAALRADMTLAGFDGFRIQRSDQTFLFLGDGARPEDAGGKELQPGSLIVLAHKDKEITDALEGAGVQPTEGEVAHEVALMSKTNMYRPGIDVTQAELVPHLNWRRQELTEAVGHWKAKVYDMLNVLVTVKSRRVPGAMTDEELFAMDREEKNGRGTELDAELDEVLTAEERKQLDSALRMGGQEEDFEERGEEGDSGADHVDANGVAKDKKGWFGWGGKKGAKNDEKPSKAGSKDELGDPGKGKEKGSGKKKKGVSSGDSNKHESEYKKGLRPVLWLTPDFPLKTDELIPLLDVLANKVKAVRRLRELLTTKLPPGTFPVKIAIPLVPTIRVIVTFTKFEELQPLDEFATPPSSPTQFQDAKAKESEGSGSWYSWVRGSRGVQSSDSGDSRNWKDEVDPFHIPSEYTWIDANEKKRRMKAKKAKSRRGSARKQSSKSTSSEGGHHPMMDGFE